MRVPFLDLKLQYANLKHELLPAISATLDTAWYIDGPATKAFEEAFARYCGVSDCVALDSGTAALQLALLALNIGPGDEVIVPTNTFIATAAAAAMVGAKVVPVDSDPATWLIDLNAIERKITSKTKAILPVHLYGQPVQMQPILDLCANKGIHVIEDAAQAQGARYREKRTGGLAEIACFSFYPGKNLGAYGDAGAVTTNDPALASRVRKLANHARVTKYEHDEIGFNLRFDEIQGVVLKHKLGKLDEWNQSRRVLADRYRKNLAGLPIEMYQVPPECEAVYHLMAICVPDPKALAKHLSEANIDSGFHYPVPVHLQPSFRSLGHKAGDFPVSEKIASHTISLPMFPEMSNEQCDYVCELICDYFAGH